MASNGDTGSDVPRGERSVTLKEPAYPQQDDLDSDTEVALPMMHHDPQSAAEALNSSVNQPPFKTMEDQPAPTGFLAWAGFGCSIFALMSLCVSFASPYWWQTYPQSFNSFQNLGLWEVCFHDFMFHKDDSQEIYNGCWWVFSSDKRYFKLREWLLPPWFITCQVLVTGCLLMEIGVCVIIGMIFLHCCPIMNHEYHQTYGMFGAAALDFLVTACSLVVGLVFGIRCQDRQWMPRPDLNLLSWGYGFFIISAIMSLAGGVLFFLQARKIYDDLMRREDDFLKAAIEASGYPTSQSQYSIDPGYGQPNYGQQSYSNQPSYEKQSYGTDPSYDKQPSYEKQPSFEKGSYHSQPSYEPDYNYDQNGAYAAKS